MPKQLGIVLQTASSRKDSSPLLVLPLQASYLLPLGHVNLLCALQKQVFFSLCYAYFTFFDPLINIVPIYDGRKRQLKVPDELRNVSAVLSRYPGEVPHHSLVLVAYTVSLYRAAQGSRKDQPTIPLNIVFAVVLHEGEDEDDNIEPEQANEPPQYQSAEEPEDLCTEKVEDDALSEEY